MNPLAPDTVALTFLVFCRIGACMMLTPGLSSSRVPARVRLFIALGFALALSPHLVPEIQRSGVDPSTPAFVLVIVGEILIGLSIGLLGRIFFLALEAMGTVIANTMGLSMPDMPIEDGEAVPAIATLITLSATMLLFVTEMHWEIVRGLLGSYQALPVSEGFAAQPSLVRLVDLASQAFVIALRIASPFIIFGLVVNLAFGLLNKMLPAIPVYFVSTPYVLAGGLALLYVLIKPMIQLVIVGFAIWLARS